MMTKNLLVVIPWLTDYKYDLICDVASEGGFKIEIFTFSAPKHKKIRTSKGGGSVAITRNQILHLLYKIFMTKHTVMAMLHLGHISGIAVLLSVLLRRRIILWDSGYVPNRRFQGIVLWFKRHLMRYTTKVIFYSNQGKINYSCLDNSDRYVVINNTIKDREIDRDVNGGCKRLVYLGGVTKKKNFLVLSDLMQRNPELRLDVIGPASKEVEIKQALRLGNINYLGPLYGDKLIHELRRSDILIMPGLGGLAVNQGMQSSLIIIAHEGDGSIRDLLSHTPNLILNKGTLEEIESCLKFLNDLSAEEIVLLKKRNRKVISDNYNYDAMVKRFVSEIEFR